MVICANMFDSRSNVFLLGLIAIIVLARPAAAFGAGNIASISKIEGQNCISYCCFGKLPC